MKADLRSEAHEIWAMAQLLPNEGIEDGVDRVEKKLKELMKEEKGETEL